MGYAMFHDLPSEIVQRIINEVDNMRFSETTSGPQFNPKEFSVFQLARVNRLCHNMVLNTLFPQGSLLIFKLDKNLGGKRHLWDKLKYRAFYGRMKQHIAQRAQIVFKYFEGSKHRNYVIMRTDHATEIEKVEGLKFLENWVHSIEDENVVTKSARIFRYGIMQAWQEKKARTLAQGGCVNGWEIESYSDYLRMVLYLWRFYPSDVDCAKSTRRSFHPSPKIPKRSKTRNLQITFQKQATDADLYTPIRSSPLGKDDGMLQDDNELEIMAGVT